MDMKIENIPSYSISYIRRIGPYGEANKEIMEELKSWAKTERIFHHDSIILGIAQDNPKITKPDECRYDTCIVVPPNFNHFDKNIKNGKISGGKYAIFRIVHTEEGLKKGWMNIFPELTNRNVQLDLSRPILERYLVNLVMKNFCELCVPII